MSSRSLVAVELGRHDWGSLREIAGTAEMVPDAIRGLLAVSAPDEVDQFYWRLENHVVAQRGLYQAALPVVSVLLAALAEGVSGMTKGAVMDLLFEIVAGESAEEEGEVGNAGLGDACRDAAREGLWLIYREAHTAKPGSAVRDSAYQILRRIELDQNRLQAMLEESR